MKQKELRSLVPNLQDKASMIAFVEIVLLFALALFGVLFVTFIRLLFEDCDAVEIELRQVEK